MLTTRRAEGADADSHGLRRASILQFGIGICVGLFFFASALRQNGNDPAVFIAVGDLPTLRADVEDLLGREVPVRGAQGHDGQHFFFQALDPLYLSGVENASHMDRPIYRSQRVLFPFVAGLGGTSPPVVIPWLMGLINVFAFGLGTASVGALAVQSGHSPWLGLTFAFNLGLLMEFDVGGSGVLAFALACSALLSLEMGHDRRSALLFALALLARETMIVFLLGVAFFGWWKTGRLRWRVLVSAVFPSAAWAIYLRTRFDVAATTTEVKELGLPFEGAASALSNLSTQPLDALLTLFLVGALMSVVVSTFRVPTPFGYGASGFALLAVFLNEFVWVTWFDVARVVSPALTAFAYMLFVAEHPIQSERESGVECAPDF